MTGDILIPPSPNWFLSKAIDSRSEDGAMVTASFKSLVVYQMLPEGGLPKILKVIPYNNEKVQLVRLYPDASHNDYGKTIACCGDSPTVRLINFQTGDTLWYHKEHQESSVNGISWGMFGEEPAVVSVDGKGRMVVWQAKHGVTRVHKFSQVNELTCVEVNPNDQSQAVIGGEKTLLVVELKDGKVLMQFQGHNSDIYCMKWFPGNCSPFSWDSTADSQAEVQPEASSANGKEKNHHKGSERDDWRSRPVPSNSNGPFIASSDTGRQIFLWDLSAKRYITKVAVPQSASSQYKKFQGKDKSQGKQHIAITWFNEDLISSTPKGELLSWKLWPGGGRYTVLHHLHSRAIYNVNMIGNAVITSGQDRVIHGYDVVNSSHLFQFPTLGACASTFAFNPHDINRLAIGSQENTIRFINFESEVPLHAHTVWQNIKGKILSISWHPEHEGKLLFGTGSGQVGWVDMSSGRVTTYSYYHQKSVYKVEWAPLMCPEKTCLKDAWCAYSFGDREIVIRSSTDAMADPVQLLPLLSEADNSKPMKDVTEFSFSCDYKYFAVGANDGQVHIYRSSDLKLTVSLAVLRKSIQHLLWQPPTSSSVSYILAIGSNENKVCIFDLSSQLQQEEINEAEILTQATRELCGHESRVVWLSWSPHKTEVLASASYDHTVQLWDTNTGEPLINYGGHINRVFRVEFSPSDPDAMYSFAEENSIHVWKPSQQSCKTPGESLATSKESRSRKMKEQVPAEEQDKEVSIEKKSGATSVVNEKATSSSTLVVSNKKAAYKSFFPKLHAVCSRKKSFFHMIILHLLALKKKDNAECPSDGKEMEEELGDELEESVSKEVKEEEECSSINDTSKDYGFLLEKDSEMPEAEDLAYALNVYGKPLQMDALLSCEIAEHGNRGNDIQADLMHCWQGSLDDRIRAAARQKKLNSFLVACAPQVSIKLWEFASEAYAEQLVEEGDIISAATYLVNINKVEESINMLLKHRYYREAMAIAKCRLGYSEELVNKITMAWAGSTVFEGAFDFAATLQVSIGQIEEAARTMARRNDHGSLFVASQLYCHAGKKDLSKSIGLLALKEACVKQEHEKIDHFLAHLPDLQWFRVISCCHSTLLKLLQQVATDKITPSISSSYYVQKTQMVNGKETTTESRAVGDPTDPTAIEDHHPTEKLPFLQYLREEWSNQGFTNAQYPQFYETITSSLSAQQMPTSVKQLWFLVSVAVCELMMSPTPELREVHLTTALNYALSWGKADQIYHLTRLLLPRGKLDFTTLASNDSDCQDESSKAVSLLRLLHHISELCLLHADLQKDEAWNELTKDFNHDGGEGKVSENPVSVGSSEGVMANQEEDVLSKSVKNGTNDNAQDELEVAKENLLKKLQGLELTDEKIYCQPKTPTELLSRLHYHGDFLLKNQDSCDLMEKISESLSEPKKLLLEVTMKLKEKGSLKDEDVQALICKVNSLKT